MESSSPVGLLPSPRQAKFLEMTIVLSILMLIHHPDKNGAPEAADKFCQVQLAYETLSK
jgi:hypothetical protein